MFVSVEEAVSAIGRGEMVLVVDDENRENEGDLTMVAEAITPEAVNFMLRFGRGLVCMPCDGGRLDELGIGLMLPRGAATNDTAFCVSIDHHSTTTGISAHERAATILAAVDDRSVPGDFARPGHVFPLRAREGGVLERPGHTEAAVDLARLAGLSPCAAICEVLNDDGSVARLPQLVSFADRHHIRIVSIEQLIAHRMSLRVQTAGA